MIFLPSNLHRLRTLRKMACEDVALCLGLKRSSLSGYENGRSEPKLQVLLDLSRFYRVPVDTLLTADLRTWSVFDIEKMQRQNDQERKGA